MNARKKSDNFKRGDEGFWREKERVEGSHIKSEGSNLVRGREEFEKTRVSIIESPGKGLPIVGNPKPTIQIGCEPKYKPSPLAIFWVRTVMFPFFLSFLTVCQSIFTLFVKGVFCTMGINCGSSQACI